MASIFSKITNLFKSKETAGSAHQTQAQAEAPTEQAPPPMSDIDRIFNAVDSLPPKAQENLDAVVGNLAQGIFGMSSPKPKPKPGEQRHL